MGTFNDLMPWTAGQYAEWRAGHGRTAAALREIVRAVAGEAAAEVLREVPDYARPDDERYAQMIELAAAHLIGGFVELLNDPAFDLEELSDFFHGVGFGEAIEGRTLDTMQKAIRLGARVAVRRLTEEAERIDPDIPAMICGGITGAIFPYLETVMSAAARGHAAAVAKTAAAPETHRRRLADLLLGDPPEPAVLKDHARHAGWSLPRTVAAVALGEGTGGTVNLPAEVLAGPLCLIVPDPEGPGRRQLMETALGDRTAVLGPAGGLHELAVSLDWARQALGLVRRGVLPGGRLIAVTDHMPTLVIMRHEDLVGRVAARRLRPLAKVRPGQRRHLAETLLACLECGFNATMVATHLHLHPQTVRYRLRQLKDLFGDAMYEPGRRLELQIVLRAWLAAHPPQETAAADTA